MLKLGYSLYTGIADNDNSIAYDNDYYSDLDINDNDFVDIDINVDDYSNFNSDYNIAFTGNSDKIESLQKELREAQGNVDYYTKEINNFTENTSATYRSTCQSNLNEATSKIKDLLSKIKNLS